MIHDTQTFTVMAKSHGQSEGTTCTTYKYTLRGLREDEIEQWANFCAPAFAVKPGKPRPSYFLRHYYNDPHRAPVLIRVMFYNKDMVASCRIFSRRVSLGNNNKGQTVLAGGIGEVCTAHEHRNRGLSKRLLQDAIQVMTNNQNMTISMLHATDPVLFPYYASCGYVCTTSYWSKVTIHPSKILEITMSSGATTTTTTVRRAQFPKDTPRLMQLHQALNESQFAGTIIRTQEYWNDYLAHEYEIHGSLWVMPTKSKDYDNNPEEDLVVAWLSLRPQSGNVLQVRDFGCCTDDDDGSSYAESLIALLGPALQETRRIQQTWTLHLPTFILHNLRDHHHHHDTVNDGCWIDWDSVKEENDRGWMYRTIGHNTELLHQLDMPTITKKVPHLMWPSDWF
jgi:predicted GNAT family N-acyltransferase